MAKEKQDGVPYVNPEGFSEATDAIGYGALGLAGGATGAVLYGMGKGLMDNSPETRARKLKQDYNATRMGQRAAKAKTLGEAIKKTGKSGIVRSGGKKYHYNKAGVLTHVEQANGKVVYTKAGAEAQKNVAPKVKKPIFTDAERRAAINRLDARDAEMRASAKKVSPKVQNPIPKETGKKPQIKLGRSGFETVDPKNEEYKNLKKAFDGKKAVTNVSENVAEAAGKQTAVEAAAKAGGRTVLGMANNVAGQSTTKTVGNFFKDFGAHSAANGGGSVFSGGNLLRGGIGSGVGYGYEYLTDGGSFAGKSGNAEGINRIVASQGGGNQDDMNSRRQEAGEAMAEYSRNLGANGVTGVLGAAGEIATGGRTFGGFYAGMSELAGGAANIGVSTGLSTIFPWNKGLTKEAYQDEIAKNMAMRGNYQREQYMKDEKEFGGDAANYIHGDLSDSSLRAQQNGAVHGAFKPDPKEHWLDGMKRKEAWGLTSRKMDELAAIDDPAQRQAWFEKNKDFLTSADLRGKPTRARFNFAREAMGGDSARALHYLNTTGEDRMLGVAAAAAVPVAPNAPDAPMAKAPMSPLAQAAQYSPQYSNPGLFGLNSQSPMGGTPQNSMGYPMGQSTMNNQNSMFSVNGMPAADWASNMSKQIQNTRIGTKSAMQQGFNNGMWQDTRPMEQRGMGGNAIAQGQADYMNARGMPTAAQWSAFTNDRQARIKNPELYNQPQQEPSIADSIRGGGVPTQPVSKTQYNPEDYRFRHEFPDGKRNPAYTGTGVRGL